jgi:hypothetical protein
MPEILATWEAEIRRIVVQGQPRQKVHEIPISKITRGKWTGGVVQAVQLLLCKHEALSSNPSPTKKGKEKKRNTTVIKRKTIVIIITDKNRCGMLFSGQNFVEK